MREYAFLFEHKGEEAGAGADAWVRNGVARAGPNPYTVGTRIESERIIEGWIILPLPVHR